MVAVYNFGRPPKIWVAVCIFGRPPKIQVATWNFGGASKNSSGCVKLPQASQISTQPPRNNDQHIAAQCHWWWAHTLNGCVYFFTSPSKFTTLFWVITMEWLMNQWMTLLPTEDGRKSHQSFGNNSYNCLLQSHHLQIPFSGNSYLADQSDVGK